MNYDIDILQKMLLEEKLKESPQFGEISIRKIIALNYVLVVAHITPSVSNTLYSSSLSGLSFRCPS